MLEKKTVISPLIVQRAMPQQRGIALILVIFIIALATIVVVNLTYSTYLSARSNSVVERSLEAEYLLKSAVNLAMALLKADNNHPEADGPKDKWAKFINGVPIPPELLGLTDQRLTIELEISPENMKMIINPLYVTNVDVKVRDRFACLFQQLGFDSDTKEVATTGIFAGAFFKSKDLVANLIDYMSKDPAPYIDGDFHGIKDSLPKGTFPGTAPATVSELAGIPGFTPHRLQVLSSLLTTYDKKININFAPPQVLKCLDPDMGDAEVRQIMEYRVSDEGPFKDGDAKFQDFVGPTIYQRAGPAITYSSAYFQIISKVDYGTKAYFARAVVARSGQNGSGEPEIMSLEMF